MLLSLFDDQIKGLTSKKVVQKFLHLRREEENLQSHIQVNGHIFSFGDHKSYIAVICSSIVSQ
jgi:hypothetical protein